MTDPKRPDGRGRGRRGGGRGRPRSRASIRVPGLKISDAADLSAWQLIKVVGAWAFAITVSSAAIHLIGSTAEVEHLLASVDLPQIEGWSGDWVTGLGGAAGGAALVAGTAYGPRSWRAVRARWRDRSGGGDPPA